MEKFHCLFCFENEVGITGVRIWNKKKQVKRLGIEEKKEEEE